MKITLHRFLSHLIVLTLVIALAGAIVFGFFLKQYFTPVIPLLLLLFSGFTYITYRWLVRNRDIGKFTRVMMLLTVLRFLIYTLTLVVCLVFTDSHPLVWAVVIGGLYLVFTFFEVSEISKYVRQ